jgi:DNA-binding NarL/FixJ family response regulator
MVVEDRVDFRRMLATLLDRQADLEVVAQAGSLRTARDHLASAPLDVILLDLNLPDGKGWELIAEMRGANLGVGIIVLSASFDGANLARADEAGADAVLDKFSAPGEVVSAVKNASAPRGREPTHDDPG